MSKFVSFLSASPCAEVFILTDRKSSISAFNLIEGIDVPAIEAKIAQYQEENAEQIMINRARKVLVKLLIFLLLISATAVLTSG